MTAQGKIQSALTSLVLENPFFGSLALSLKMVPDNTCKTAWVDGRTLGYNPPFVDGMSHAQVTALLAHEVMHCALGHPWRRDGRDAKGWNIATDKSINGDLRESFTLPDGVLYPDGDEVGKSSEWIFARMREENQPEQPNGEPDQDDSQGDDSEPGNGDGPSDQLGEVRDAPTGPDSDGEPAPTEDDWKQNAASALQQSKAMGKVPGGMARLVQRALRSRVDVRSLLLRFFSERSTGDFSWSKPSTRYMSMGLYLPCLESKGLGEIAIAIDTSGSVDETSLAYARSILESTIEEVSPLAVTVYYFDSKVQSVDRFERGDTLTWKPQGGGGTDFTDVLKTIDRDGTAVCTVVITDLCGTFPVAPSLPVIWLSTEDGMTAPFGETVYLDR